MSTVSSDLTKIQEKLNDNGSLWTRAELLRWYNDGYRQFMAQSGAFSRFMPLDVPGRHTYSCSYPWEDRHVTGTYWFPLNATYNAQRHVAFLWEVEFLEGLKPTNSRAAIMQQWERVYSGDVDVHFMFGLPKEHERVRRLAWDEKLLLPVSVREFDEVDDGWMRRVGEPTWWTTGIGRSRTVEVYEIRTDYQAGYFLTDFDVGTPRGFTGRTYSVETKGFERSNDYAYTTLGDSDALTRASTSLLSGLGWQFSKTVSLLGATYRSTILRDNPIAYWRLGEISGTDAYDESGKGHTGTYTGPTLYQSGGLVNDVNKSANFDGVDDYVEMPDAVDLRMTGGGTIEAWIRPVTVGEVAGRIIDKSTNTAGANGYLLFLSATSLVFVVDSGTQTASSTNVIRFGEWHHVVVTFNSSGRQLYVNGIDVTSSGGSLTALPPDVAGVVRIGNRPGATDRTFDGLIDEVAEYGSALTASQVLNHYNVGIQGLLAYFTTQTWEKQQLEGTTQATGVTVGSYAWEEEFGAPAVAFGLGSIRGVTSPDRQYLPLVTDAGAGSLLGVARDWRTTEDALSALEVVLPERDLVETDEPALLPAQMQKYLRYYVLSRAFGREGEGHRPDMAAHYDARFKRGVALMKRLADVAHKDRVFVTEAVHDVRRRPPRVHLPSEFPQVF